MCRQPTETVLRGDENRLDLGEGSRCTWWPARVALRTERASGTIHAGEAVASGQGVVEMPFAPARKCKFSSCHGSEPCARHCCKQADYHRPSAARRGYDGRWRKYRLAFLHEHPVCRACEAQGEYRLATDVDHIIPVNGKDDPLFWDTENHQPLCSKHHKAKSINEMRATTASY